MMNAAATSTIQFYLSQAQLQKKEQEQMIYELNVQKVAITRELEAACDESEWVQGIEDVIQGKVSSLKQLHDFTCLGEGRCSECRLSRFFQREIQALVIAQLRANRRQRTFSMNKIVRSRAKALRRKRARLFRESEEIQTQLKAAVREKRAVSSTIGLCRFFKEKTG